MTAASTPVVAAVLVAAGSGERLGAGVPKAFVEIDGSTLLEHATRRFVEHPSVRTVVVVAPPGAVDAAVALLADVGAVTVVPGGATRQLSVEAGLERVPGAGIVLVHDVARPFVPAAVIGAVIDAVAAGADAAVPVLPIHDTVRRVGPDGSFAGLVDRAGLVAIQTPQAFRAPVLAAAHAAGRDLAVTDDAALVEAAGGTVVPVPGSEQSFKITTPLDLDRAATLLRSLSGARPTPL